MDSDVRAILGDEGPTCSPASEWGRVLREFHELRGADTEGILRTFRLRRTAGAQEKTLPRIQRHDIIFAWSYALATQLSAKMFSARQAPVVINIHHGFSRRFKAKPLSPKY